MSNNEIELKINRYITESDATTRQFLDWIDNLPQEGWSLMSFPTGTGKTTAFEEYCKHKPSRKKVLFAPTRSLVQNIGKGTDIKSGFGFEFIHNDVKRKREFITTYDSIRHLNDVDDVFIDEAHLIAGHSSFREVLQNIIEAKGCRVILMSGTPEIVEDIKGIKILKGNVKDKVKKSANVVGSKGFRSKSACIGIAEMTIERIIEAREWDAMHTVPTTMIRINSKDTIEEIFQMFKGKLRVAKFYSDEDNVVGAEQTEEMLQNLKRGKIRNVDLLLVTSIYDAGLSLDVDRNVDCYAVSENKDLMPNPIDMTQLERRVRPNTGYTMSLTILGTFGTFEPDNEKIDLNKLPSKQVLKKMEYQYNNYRQYWESPYIGILEFYGIKCNVGGEQPFNGKSAKYVGHQKKITIAKNLNNFAVQYDELIDKAKHYDRYEEVKQAITGDNSFRGDVTGTVMGVVNAIDDSFEINLHLDLFMGRTFDTKRVKNLKTLSDTFYYVDDEVCHRILNELITGIDKEGSRVNLEGLNLLTEPQQAQIKSLGNLLYKKINWNRKSFKLNPKDDLTKERNYINTLTQNNIMNIEIIATCIEQEFIIRRYISKDTIIKNNGGSMKFCIPSIVKVRDIDFKYLDGVKGYNWINKE